VPALIVEVPGVDQRERVGVLPVGLVGLVDAGELPALLHLSLGERHKLAHGYLGQLQGHRGGLLVWVKQHGGRVGHLNPKRVPVGGQPPLVGHVDRRLDHHVPVPHEIGVSLPPGEVGLLQGRVVEQRGQPQLHRRGVVNVGLPAPGRLPVKLRGDGQRLVGGVVDDLLRVGGLELRPAGARLPDVVLRVVVGVNGVKRLVGVIPAPLEVLPRL